MISPRIDEDRSFLASSQIASSHLSRNTYQRISQLLVYTFIYLYIYTFPKLQEQVSRGVETLPRTACYLMSGSLFSLRVVLNAESGALRSQNTPGGYGSLAFSGEAH